jgi:integrase
VPAEDTNMLTDLQIKRIKPIDRPVKISDAGGLHLLVQPSGSMLWRMAYRFHGRQKTLAFGRYPDVSLAMARIRRDEAKAKLRQDIDPGMVVKAEKQAIIAATANSFAAVADEWLERKIIKQKRSDGTVSRARWLLDKLNASLGDRPLGEIEAPELLDVLRRVEAQELFETVARLRATASAVFRYGIATGRCKRDVAADLKGATTSAVSTPHAAITDPNGIGELMRAIDGYQHSDIMRLALQFLALTFVRPGELRFAEWSEIDGNVWTIPAERMKMRTAHRIPLSRQALAVLDELRELTGGNRYLFLAPTLDKPIGETALNIAVRRLGYGSDDMVPHGFRATASTILNESGLWAPDVIERQLAHAPRNKVRATYNRAMHWPERVAMMQWYADYLHELRGRGEVVPLVAAQKK